MIVFTNTLLRLGVLGVLPVILSEAKDLRDSREILHFVQDDISSFFAVALRTVSIATLGQ